MSKTCRIVKDRHGYLQWETTVKRTTIEEANEPMRQPDYGARPNLTDVDVSYFDVPVVEIVDGPLGRMAFRLPAQQFRVITETEVFVGNTIPADPASAQARQGEGGNPPNEVRRLEP